MAVLIKGTRALESVLKEKGKVISITEVRKKKKKVAEASSESATSDSVVFDGQQYKVKGFKPKRKKTPENKVKKAILDFLHLNGIFVWRQNSFAVKIDNKYFVRATEPGCPDIMGILPPNGRILCIEVKAPGGRLTKSQKKFLERAASLGALVVVAYSVDDVKNALLAEGYELRCK